MRSPTDERRRKAFILSTTGGIFAVLMWSSTIAVARSLTEQVGPLSSAAGVYAVGGVAGIIRLLISPRRFKQMFTLPKKYLIGCGLLFAAYMLALFLAVGLADSRLQVLEVGLLNYLWPALTIVFSLVLLRHRAHWLLAPGTALGIAGVFLVLTQGTEVSWASFMGNLVGNPPSYALGFAAAVLWALYSNLTRRWAGSLGTGAVELFLPATGGLLILAAFAAPESPVWTPKSIGETVFLGLLTWLGYMLWDNAMRRGDMMLVAAASYFTPLFSTIVIWAYLRVTPEPALWLGCALLVAGSLLSWASVRERREGAVG